MTTKTIEIIPITEHKSRPLGVNTWLIDTPGLGLTDVLAAYRRRFNREPVRIWRLGNNWWCEVMK